MITVAGERRWRHVANWLWMFPIVWLLVGGLLSTIIGQHPLLLHAIMLPILVLVMAPTWYYLQLAWHRTRPLTYVALALGCLAGLLAGWWSGWQAGWTIFCAVILLVTRAVAWWPDRAQGPMTGMVMGILQSLSPLLILLLIIGGWLLYAGGWKEPPPGHGPFLVMLVAIPGVLLTLAAMTQWLYRCQLRRMDPP